MLPTTLYTYAFHRSRTLEEWIDCAQGTEAEGIKLALTWQSRVLLSILAPLAHNWTEWQKTRQKLDFKNLVKLPDPTCAFKQFDNFQVCNACNHRKQKSCKSAENRFRKISKITSSEIIFGGLLSFETNVRTGGRRESSRRWYHCHHLSMPKRQWRL